jgi:hypothetical protein
MDLPAGRQACMNVHEREYSSLMNRAVFELDPFTFIPVHSRLVFQHSAR